MRQALHLVRPGAEPAALAEHDWVVYLDPRGPRLAARGAPPHPPGPIDHDALIALTFAAAIVITW